jgi:hypothetical protein
MTFSAGRAQLPAVMIGFEDAAAVEEALDAGTVAVGTIHFSGVVFAGDPARLFAFSSRGPTYTDVIKPDLSATGYVYTAVQSWQDEFVVPEIFPACRLTGLSVRRWLERPCQPLLMSKSTFKPAIPFGIS